MCAIVFVVKDVQVVRLYTSHQIFVYSIETTNGHPIPIINEPVRHAHQAMVRVRAFPGETDRVYEALLVVAALEAAQEMKQVYIIVL